MRILVESFTRSVAMHDRCTFYIFANQSANRTQFDNSALLQDYLIWFFLNYSGSRLIAYVFSREKEKSFDLVVFCLGLISCGKSNGDWSQGMRESEIKGGETLRGAKGD